MTWNDLERLGIYKRILDYYGEIWQNQKAPYSDEYGALFSCNLTYKLIGEHGIYLFSMLMKVPSNLFAFGECGG